ncbi:MAG: hypothetical protein M3O15_06600, partial [Acidobacteriota bacterium]|nr:hypothetical protein [Acidobacteriota bacterium]
AEAPETPERTEGAAAPTPRRNRSLETYEALLARSQAERHDDPVLMVELAWLASRLAGHLDGADHTPAEVADRQARAWGELANAYRVSGNLEQAERTMVQALGFSMLGSGDPAIGARLCDLRASLLGDQRHWKAAFGLLDVAHATHLQQGDRHNAGRALISKGIYTGYSGEPESAVELIGQGLATIDQDRDPHLTRAAIQSKAVFLVDAGLFREARTLLWQNRGRFITHCGHIDRLKLLGLEGRINAALGHPDRAERAFRQAREGFAEAGLRYHVALLSLDLATLHMQQRRTAQAQAAAEEAAEIFIALEIGREALAALFILRRAFEVEMVTATLLSGVADFMRRFELDPEARYEPRFE